MGFADNVSRQGEGSGAPGSGLAGAADKIQGGAGRRLQFIRKVYLTMTGAIALGGVAGLAGYAFAPVIMPLTPILAVGCLLGFLGMLFMRENQTYNKVLLVMYSVFQGLFFGGAVYPDLQGTGDAHIFWMAVGTTIAVFGSLTAYVFATRKDFSFLGGFLHVMVWGMFLSGMFSLFMGFDLISTLPYNLLGLAMVTGFILYDTSNVLHYYDDDQYVAAALMLVWDFFYLLWRLVLLFSGDRD